MILSSSKRAGASESESWGETIKTFVIAVLLALGIRTTLFEPFNIPSESMLPTLLVGDYLFVSKYSYGYSKHSLPFSLPLFKGRILEKPVTRGDVAVFKLPRDNHTDYIKRIVGLPGDRLQMKGGVLYINGQKAPQEAAGLFSGHDHYGHLSEIPQLRETLPGGRTHLILDLDPEGEVDNTNEYIVPQGYYFAMGDNRDNSLDSRFPARIGVGYVPAENLVGRAEIIFFSVDDSLVWWQPWTWISAMRFERFFTLIK